MPKEIIEIIKAKDTEISVVFEPQKDDYFSLTDIARYKDAQYPGYIIQNWMRNRSTVEFLGVWERLNNPDFNYLEFEAIENEAGKNSFVLTPKRWVEQTNAIGLRTKSGRYGATYAHKDIAFEFASWISPEFKLYIIQDYQRLKTSEAHQLALDWNVKRLIAKANYKIHTEAIKDNLIPPDISKREQSFIYANEADMLNAVLFGITAKQWREQNPDKKGNIRDYASIEQLLVLSNLENANALLIGQGYNMKDRALKLNKMAIEQMRSLTGLKSVKEIKGIAPQEQKLLTENSFGD